MTRLSIVLPCLLWCACAVESAAVAPESLMEGQGDAVGVKGLERLEGSGAYLAGATERFRVHVDDTKVARVTFTASAGALTASGRTAEWKLPNVSSAQLSVKVTGRDGSEGTMSWQFAVAPLVENNRPMTAQAALLATPMPVLDGGSLEISGGGCEVRYEGSTNNIAIAFTTQTHPSLMYGRWNGAAWSLEVVDAMGFNTGGVIDPVVSMQVEANGTPHVVYVREGTVMYATKAGANWVRERVDGTTQPLSGNLSTSLQAITAPSIAVSGTTVAVAYQTGTGYSGSPYRPVIAVRTGAGAWTRTSLSGAVSTSSSNVYLHGELTIDGAGRLLFPSLDYTATTDSQLVAWTSASGRSSVPFPNSLSSRTSVAVASPARLYALGGFGVMDVSLATTFASSTMQRSLVETFTTSQHAIAADSAGLPRLVVNHGSTLEVVRSMGSPGFWEWLELGPADSGLIDASVDGANETRACFVRAGKLMLY